MLNEVAGLNEAFHHVKVFMLHSRSVSVDPDGVDTVLGETTALQEGAVIADVHALAGVVAALEQLNAVVLSMLMDRKQRYG